MMVLRARRGATGSKYVTLRGGRRRALPFLLVRSGGCARSSILCGETTELSGKGVLRSLSSSSAIRLRPHRSGQAAFPHPALPGSHPHGAARGVQGGVIRGGGGGRHAG